MQLFEFEEKIGYIFKNKDLLRTALTHSSFSESNYDLPGTNNERLEFLGDAVLEIVITDYLFFRFPDMSEGELTKMRAGVVCEKSLAKKAKELEIGELIILGRGEIITGGRNKNSLLSNAFEAVAGAVYIDGGYSFARDFILKNLSPVVDEVLEIYNKDDHKHILQVMIQKKSPVPVAYIVTDTEGPDHNKIFNVQAVHNDKILGRGSGKSKKEAEQNAAYDAINPWLDF